MAAVRSCYLRCPSLHAAAVWELPALLMAQLCPAAGLSPKAPSHISKAVPCRDGCGSTHGCDGQQPASSMLNGGHWRAFPRYPSLQFLLYLCYVGTSLSSRNPHLSLLLPQILPHDLRT